MVAGDVSAHTTTSTVNTIAIEHLHLMMCMLTGGSMNACSKFAHECDIACGQYRIYIRRYVHSYIS